MPSIVKIKFYALQIPLRVSFKHASATRSAGYSLWLEVVSETGIVGYGESCPRDYVTGETFETAQRFYRRFEQEWITEIDDMNALRSWVFQHNDCIDQNPAAWCAVEMAFIDCWGRENKKSWEAILGNNEVDGRFNYTAVLGDQDEPTFRTQFEHYLDWGFTTFKVKLSGDPKRDAFKQSTLNDGGVPGSRLRWDAPALK